MANHAHSIPALAPGEPTRRRLMSAFSGAAFAGTALVIAAPSAADAHPDAELLAVLAEFEDLERTIYPRPGPPTIEAEEAWEGQIAPLRLRQEALLEHLCEMRTHTLEGFRARVGVLLRWTEYFMKKLETQADEGYWPEKMQLALFRDLAGERAA